MPEELGYRVHAGEPAIFVEIYLPKKADFQGRLYDALTRGFDLDAVKEHFQDSSRRERIHELFRRYDARVPLDDERLAALREVFFGYSLYEVDGVFRGKNGGPKIQEERSQIVRVIFKPDYGGIAERAGTSVETARELAGERLHSYRERNGSVLLDSRGRTAESEKLVAEEIRSFMDDVSLFLFGYIVYEICERIAELRANAQKCPEDEIWVTSFWGMTVNRVEGAL